MELTRQDIVALLADLGDDPNRHTVFDSPGCSVIVPSPEYLLAMKVYAARVDRDADDLLLLAGLCGITTSAGALDLAEIHS